MCAARVTRNGCERKACNAFAFGRSPHAFSPRELRRAIGIVPHTISVLHPRLMKSFLCLIPGVSIPRQHDRSPLLQMSSAAVLHRLLRL